MIRFAIVGCGLIGDKRANALKKIEDAEVAGFFDLTVERANALSSKYGGKVFSSIDEVYASDADVVLIATANSVIPVIACNALKAGKNVFAEKPSGRSPEEIQSIVRAADEAGKKVGIGFNHRFHPAFLKAKTILASGKYGPLMYIRARYGHGGRVGYEKEWRGDPHLSGGGELLDQGVHLIDLCRYIGGEFELEWGKVDNYFWNWAVEDNGFLCLKSVEDSSSNIQITSKTASEKSGLDGRVKRAWIHVSCTEWKNLFDFEIFLKDAKIQIAGLGRSYGVEELRLYKMKPEMGPPEIEIEKFEGEDESWQLELKEFVAEIQGVKPKYLAHLEDARQSLAIVYSAYRNSKVNWL